MEYFADAPHASNEDFIRDVMAPRLGGQVLAERYFEMAGLCLDPAKAPQAALEIARITAGITDYPTLRRWQYLASFLNSFAWEWEHGNDPGKNIAFQADRADQL